VLTRQQDDTWDAKIIREAHKTGVNAGSWAPVTGDPVATGEAPVMRLVTGGCDNMIKLWTFNGAEWTEEQEPEPKQLSLHTDWVRDVAFAPSLGAAAAMFASCSQDKKVVIWTQAADSAAWSYKVITFSCAVWRVSWSVTGNILAVSGGDNHVTLWKDNLLGDWEQIGALSEDGTTTKS